MTAGRVGFKCASDRKSEDLRLRLEARTKFDPNFWAFSNLKGRSGSHALFQYPAMMVPELQGALLDDLTEVDAGVLSVYDPFSGSGTVMLECLYRGIDFFGSDINPMAILLCEVKSSPPEVSALSASMIKVFRRAEGSEKVPQFDFPNINKWFKPEVKDGLARLRLAIAEVDSRIERRFLWVCLAETIRLVSNSRISTFKLHIYSPEDIARREVNAVKVFRTVCQQNLKRLALHWERISGIPEAGRRATAKLSHGCISSAWQSDKQADVLMTSPPYGDNKTTVPYGQHSYLALRWIDPRDVHEGFDLTLLDSTSRIDSLSLGGSIRAADDSRSELVELSPALGQFLRKIEHAAPLRKKILAFCRDYKKSLSSLSPRVRLGAFCFFTLGERRVGGEVFPLVDVTKDFLRSNGHEVVTVIERVLPGSKKRMAAKNKEGMTMASEWILVTRSWRV